MQSQMVLILKMGCCLTKLTYYLAETRPTLATRYIGVSQSFELFEGAMAI